MAVGDCGFAAIKHPDCLYIDGAWVTPSTTRKLEVINPATEDTVCHVAEAMEPDVERAVAAARRAFDSGPWPLMSHEERAGLMRAVAERVRARAPDYAQAWTQEVGTLFHVAQHAAEMAAGQFDAYADLARTFRFEEAHNSTRGAAAAFLVHEPVGVVAAIIPWNAPLQLLAIKVAPAMLAGCTIVIKASPEAPLDAYIFAEICEEVGLPSGVINMLVADRQVSEQLVRNRLIDKVSFTGSTAAGSKIASICGERVARVTLELGGKSAAVVLDDYGIEEAASALAQATPMLSGQVCAALTRIIVPRHRHDDLVDALSTAFRSIRIGEPYDGDAQLGPLAMKRQLERVEGFVANGVEDGARLVTGGRRPTEFNRGYYFEPTVFANVDNRSTIARDEIFGPVVSVIPASSEEDAIRLADDSDYGLNACVFTNDAACAYDVARRLRSGTVSHNKFMVDTGISFGGFKRSGIGREGGTVGLLPYLESKTILLARALS